MIKENSNLFQILFWVLALVIVLICWPRESIDREPVVKYIVIDRNIWLDELTANIEQEQEPVTVEPRYGFTEDEIYLMTVLLAGSKDVDGDGEYDVDFSNQDNTEQINLVLCTVMNRVRSELFPNTVSEVIWARNQFSPMSKWKNGLPTVSPETLEIVRAWCEAYDTYDLSIQTIPENHLYFTGNGVINKSR